MPKQAPNQLPQPKKLEAYQTSDGKIFTSEVLATSWEGFLAFKASVMKHNPCMDAPEDMLDYLQNLTPEQRQALSTYLNGF